MRRPAVSSFTGMRGHPTRPGLASDERREPAPRGSPGGIPRGPVGILCKLMEIVKYPEPILRKVAKPLEEIDDAVRERARGMLDLMYRDRGVGLAAPQVGWSTRLF